MLCECWHISASQKNKPKIITFVKTLFLVTLVSLCCISVQAATLATWAGPAEATSYSSYQAPLTTIGSITQALYSNTVTYDAVNVVHGNGGSGTAYLLIVVKRVAPYTTYSSTYATVQTGGSINISVPSNQGYTVSFYTINTQGYSPTNYKSLRLSNVTISN